MLPSSIKSLTVVFSVLLITSCVSTFPKTYWKIEPRTQRVQNECFKAEIIPWYQSAGNYVGFLLTIENLTTNNIEVNWNKTLFISNGQTSGGFMFEGIVYKDRNNQKSPDVIFQKGKLSKIIWPNNLVHFESGRYGGWIHETMTTGENGIYLTVFVDAKEINEKIVMLFSNETL